MQINWFDLGLGSFQQSVFRTRLDIGNQIKWFDFQDFIFRIIAICTKEKKKCKRAKKILKIRQKNLRKKSKKSFSKKKFFSSRKSLSSHLIIKKSKKFFFRKIGFESLISHGSALSFKISRVAPVERKSIFTISSCFKRKIFQRDLLQIWS